jgi:hypothetical protein
LIINNAADLGLSADLTSLGNVSSTGSLEAGGSTLTVGGDLMLNGAGFAAGTGAVVLATSTPGIVQHITSPGPVTFYNLTASSSAFIVAVSSPYLYTINGDFSVIANTFDLFNGSSVTVQGNSDVGASANLVIDSAPSVFTANGTFANDGLVGDNNDGTYVFNGPVTNNGNFSADGNFPITWIFNSSWSNPGTFESGSSTVLFSGSSQQNVPAGLTFYNLTVSSTADTVLTGDTTTTNDFTINPGYVGINTVLHLAGDFKLGPTCDANAGNCQLFDWSGNSYLDVDGSHHQSLADPDGVFLYYQVVINNSNGGVSTVEYPILNPEPDEFDIGTAGRLTLLRGTFSPDGLLFIGSNYQAPIVMAGGVFDAGSSTVKYTGFGSTQTVASTTFNNLELRCAGSCPRTYSLDASTTVLGTLNIPSHAVLSVGTNTLTAPGTITNSGLITENTLGGGTIIHPYESIHFTNSSGNPVTSYNSGSNIYLQVQDSNRNLDGTTTESFTIPVQMSVGAGGDHETLTLNETGVATGIFRSGPIQLVSSNSVTPGNNQFEITGSGNVSSTYIDIQDATDYGSASATVTYSAPTPPPTYSGGGGGGGNGSGPFLPPVVATYQTYTSGGSSASSSLSGLGVSVNALVKLPCLTDAASKDPNDVCKAVYYIDPDGMRHAFPNSKVYFTWYADFSQVQLVNATQLASIPLGKNVTYKPGVKMVKFTTDNKVYAVAKGAVLHWVSTQDLAASLYGSSWNTNIDDINDAFHGDYTFGADVKSSTDFNPTTVQASVQTPGDNLGA